MVYMDVQRWNSGVSKNGPLNFERKAVDGLKKFEDNHP